MGPNTRQTNIPGLDIPTHDYIAFTYYGTTNNVATATYYTGGSGGTVVATVTVNYVGGTPGTDNARILNVSK